MGLPSDASRSRHIPHMAPREPTGSRTAIAAPIRGSPANSLRTVAGSLIYTRPSYVPHVQVCRWRKSLLSGNATGRRQRARCVCGTANMMGEIANGQWRRERNTRVWAHKCCSTILHPTLRRRGYVTTHGHVAREDQGLF